MSTLLQHVNLTEFVDVARQLGLDPYRQLRQAGISPTALVDPEMRVPAKSVTQLLEDSAQLAGLEDLGLRVAEARQLTTQGPLWTVMREGATLRNALDAMARYLHLLNEGIDLRIETVGDAALVRLELLVYVEGSMRQSTEFVICLWFRLFKLLAGSAWKPRSVCFSHAAPASLATHRRVFGVPVRFRQDFDGIVLAASDLDVAGAASDPALGRHAREFLDIKLAQSGSTMPDKVRKLVFALLPAGECGAEQVARQLGIDRKTMHRHLAAYGQNYLAVVDAVRVDLVTRYVKNSERPLSEVAILMGFSSLSAFSRWFSMRFGCSVSAWRRQPPAPENTRQRCAVASGAPRLACVRVETEHEVYSMQITDA
ncbi:AraC family transcriptional regulator [Cupriavidus oxalaticus]|uniref:AraC family transcriptional regulator n=1 Tax=Cupriavidus oxalaticus TaxID=96344 RepID=A0A4P7LHJ8_9BURK|nr:AraC family transcriptional regulator [Cupriavidus oxalaticus]QBY55128.1 AraC family transcriptional regulator [Cupriavidus oxalaticus]